MPEKIYGFTEEAMRRVIADLRRLESMLRNGSWRRGRGPLTQEGCWVRLTAKTEVDDADAQEKKVGAYDWTLVMPDANGRFTYPPIEVKGAWDADPERDTAAYEVNKSNANFHVCYQNIVRLRPGFRAGNTLVQMLFDKGLSDPPFSCAYVFQPQVAGC